MIPAAQHPVFTPLVREYVRFSLRGHFASVRVHLEAPDSTPIPTLFHATHVSWWDGFLGLAVADHLGLDVRVMMLETQLKRYGFLRFGGAFGFTPGDPASVREAIRYAAKELETDPPSALFVFPAGEIASSLRRPLPHHPGAASIGLHARSPVRAVAWRLEHRGEAKPEAIIRVAAPRRVGTASLRDLSRTLQNDLEATTDALEADLRTGTLESYQPALRGLVSAQEGWDRVRRLLGARA